MLVARLSTWRVSIRLCTLLDCTASNSHDWHSVFLLATLRKSFKRSWIVADHHIKPETERVSTKLLSVNIQTILESQRLSKLVHHLSPFPWSPFLIMHTILSVFLLHIGAKAHSGALEIPNPFVSNRYASAVKRRAVSHKIVCGVPKVNMISSSIKHPTPSKVSLIVVRTIGQIAKCSAAISM